MVGVVTADLLAATLRANGADPDSVEPVSGAPEPVFLVRIGGQEQFAKVLTDRKAAEMRELLERGGDVGLPESRLVRGERNVLLSAPAAGWPLSRVLLCCLFPGAWSLTSNRLTAALTAYGRALGRLHTDMALGERTAGDDDCRIANWIGLGSRARDRLDADDAAAISGLFDGIGGTSLPFTRVHGDPSPHNLFVSLRTGRTKIIDFNLHRSLALEDVVVLEAGIELMVGRLPYGRSVQRPPLVRAFRSGYERTGVHDPVPDRETAVLKLAYYTHLLDKYGDGRRRNTRRERLTERTDRRVIFRRIGALLERVTGDGRGA